MNSVIPSDQVKDEHDKQSLRLESLHILILATCILACLWILALAIVVGDVLPSSYVLPFALIAASVLTYRLSQWHQNLACVSFPIALLFIFSLYLWYKPHTMIVFLIPSIVFMSSAICSRRCMISVTAGSCVALLVLSWLKGNYIGSICRMAVLPTAVTALVAWLAMRNLYAVLAWTVHSEATIRRHLEDLRERRAELRKLTNELRQSQESLHYLNISLRQSRLAAEEAYRAKQDFAVTLSHELRTPLNLIVGFAEMMVTAPENYGEVSLPSPYRGDLMTIYRSARHLSDLLDDILDLARIEADRMPLVKEPAQLGETVRDAVDMVRDFAKARGLQLELEIIGELPLLPLDTTRIRQVVLNLLTNAIRYTDEGWIRVSVCRDNQDAIVSVSDTGPGIDSDAVARAFRSFSQLDSRHVYEGSGLGLAVSKQFIELHSGRIWIDSKLGQGTTVGFTLPLPAKAEKLAKASRLISTPVSHRPEAPLVLVLHDDESALSILRRHVEGYEFLLVADVHQAFETISELAPTAIVVDSACGDAWAELATKGDEIPQIPVITCPLPSAHRQGLLLGATDFLPKPVTQERLLAALGQLPEPPETVLVIDDNPDFVRLLTRMLQGAPSPPKRVLEAFNGKGGLELARSQQPDVVLLDLLMPEMGGYEFMEEAKSDEYLEGTAIIVVSVQTIQHELAPIAESIQMRRAKGFSLTEVMQALQAMLSTVRRPVAVGPANGAMLARDPSA